MDDLTPTGDARGVPADGPADGPADVPAEDLTDDPTSAETDGAGIGDADLVAQVRDGHDEPYAELYRRHQPAALALARTLTEHTSADDVVSEAFEKLLQRIRGGGGPESAFRPYLLRTVRTVAVDASRRTRRLVVAEDPEDAARSLPAEGDELVEGVHERTTLARAFAALPERWQTFLWLSFVDDADRREIATILGINLGSVSALGYRAREGLRRAYLDAHLQDAPTPECSQVWPLLAGAVRGGLGPTQQAEVEEHLARCDHCRAAAAELEAVNTRFGAVLAPIVLGAAAPAYLAAVKAGGSAASAGAAAAVAGTDGAASATEMVGTAAATSGATDVGIVATVLGGLGKAGVAVVACTSTVALVVLLAVFTAPLGSELTVTPRPGITTSDGGEGSSEGGAAGTRGTGEPLATATSGSSDGSSSPGDPTSSATDDPSTSGTPTSGATTATPTAGPTGVPTFTTTSNPTGGPTTAPTTGPPTPSGTVSPTAGGTLPPTPSASPTPNTTPTTAGPNQQTPTQSPTPTTNAAREVDAGLGSLVVQARSQTSAPAHIEIPVRLQQGTADLQISVTVVGLNKFTRTSGPGEGGWGCLAVTPMAGAGKTAVVRCTLRDAAPGDPLTLGLDLGYAGDGSVRAVLDVLAPVVDVDGSDNIVSADLPPRQA